MISVAWCILGLAALVLGAELLVRAGTRLAALIGIPPIVVGLTVVSVGTSIPELAVGIDAARLGSGSLAVGNIAGTNTFNILFILGLSALLVPLKLELRSVRIDLPIMVASAAALLLMGWDGTLTAFEGSLLVAAAALYTLTIIRSAQRESRVIAAEFAGAYSIGPVRQPIWEFVSLSILLILGIAVVVVGADWLVKSSIELARLIEVSEAFIGLTIVAVGTSSPELVTTIVSTIRGQRDIAVGNLIGSSIYNILFILGVTLLVTPAGIQVEPALIQVDIPVMAAVALACVPIFMSGRCISRLEGGLLVTAYMVYLGYLIAART
jgi:cation:H+ antiporter